MCVWERERDKQTDRQTESREDTITTDNTNRGGWGRGRETERER